MLNQLLKFTLVSSLLLWLRPRWRGLLVLTVVVLLVHVFHSEYLSYVELSGNDRFLLASYAIKWVALLATVMTYYLLAMRGLSAPRAPAAQAQPPQPKALQGAAPGDDGFDFLRNKKELEGKADKVIARRLKP